MNHRLFCLIVCFFICLPVASGTPAGRRTKPEPVSEHPLIGTWQSSQFGKQTLITKADGTAQLKMRLSPMVAVLYGKELTLDLTWKLNGDTLVQTVTGGSPEAGVKKLTGKYGETYTYRILESSRELLTVEETNSGKISHWIVSSNP